MSDIESMKALHAKQAAWIARNPGNAARMAEHDALTARIASMQPKSSNYRITTNRPVRATRTRPERPEGGYHIRDVEPVVSELVGMDHAAAIREAVKDIEEIGPELERIDERLSELEFALSKAADAWDRQELNYDIELYLNKRSIAWWQMAQAAGDVSAHGGYMLDDGGIPNIPESVVLMVNEHMPGLLTGRTWQAISQAVAA